jgi:signal transduction histidine kinase
VVVQLRTVMDGASTGDGAGLPSVLFARVSHNLRVADGSLALVVAGLSLVQVIRPGEVADLTAAALAVMGGLSLAWRRTAPMTVLIVSAACFCVYQSMHFAHPALPFAMLIALYTVAARSGTMVSAGAAGALLISAVGADIHRRGWPTDYDDALLAYALSVGAACALGYGVQLSRTRTQLLREQASVLMSAHSAHEQQVIALEQARIARELHDVIAHQVSLVTALAAGAKRVFDTEPELAREAFNSIEVAGREALVEMRRLLHVLRADADDDCAQQPGLEQLPALVAHTEAAGLPVRLSVDGLARTLPAGVQMCVYRIAQEALTNTLKHAGPAQVTIQLSYRPNALELHICDDGWGVRANSGGVRANSGGGNGLIGMQERAALMGGRLLVGVGPSGGVEVSAWLPTDTELP